MTGSGPILRPGRNFWREAEASRLAFLIDGNDYFGAVAAAMEKARRRICIVGWDFDSNMRLRPSRTDDLPLGQFLRRLVERTPSLHIRILVWRGAIVYGHNAEMSNLLFDDWRDHTRIDFRFDGTAPVGASHHEKIVTIDDTLAFLGGIDLTRERWDDREHSPRENARLSDGRPYAPVHDIQVMFEGAAARLAAECVNERWQKLGEDQTETLPLSADLWPAGIKPDLDSHPVALARTRPAVNGDPGIREIEPQLLDAIASARRLIYIETQYFTLESVAEALAARLGEKDGPEIVIAVMQVAQGLLEHYAMAQERDRLFARLCKTTYHRRVGMFFPVAKRDPLCEIKVHSKLMIVDDTFLRIGSANLNRRSMGLDTECDLALEAQDRASRRAVRRLRDNLLAEHLGVEMATWRATLEETESCLAAIGRLNRRQRGFKAYEVDTENPPAPLPGIGMLDPDGPPLRVPSFDDVTSALGVTGDKAAAKSSD